MSDLSEIHEKINKNCLTLTRIDERLQNVLPSLATKSDVKDSIHDHVAACPGSRKSNPPRNGDRLLKIGLGTGVPLGLYGLVELVLRLLDAVGI